MIKKLKMLNEIPVKQELQSTSERKSHQIPTHKHSIWKENCNHKILISDESYQLYGLPSERNNITRNSFTYKTKHFFITILLCAMVSYNFLHLYLPVAVHMNTMYIYIQMNTTCI